MYEEVLVNLNSEFDTEEKQLAKKIFLNLAS